MILGVPSGIGDVSWLWSKLRHVAEEFDIHLEVADGWPYRTVPYLELLPELKGRASYGKHDYAMIRMWEQLHPYQTWDDIARSGFGRFFLEPNDHLERGFRLESWLPDLPTDFHYPMRTAGDDVMRAERLLADLPRPVYGVSCASYRGSEAWSTWGPGPWLQFLRRHLAEVGGTLLFMGGYWDDLTHTVFATLEDELTRRRTWFDRVFSRRITAVADTVGLTSVGAAVEVLRRLDGYVGFSSGLGVLGTVLHKPVFMLWPEHQQGLSESWAPPEMLEDGRYVASRWLDPGEVWPRYRRWLSR